MHDRVILTDVDGVMLNWLHSFTMWMASNGYKHNGKSTYDPSVNYDITTEQANGLMKMFNESTFISRLPPMRDAIKYIRKLHEEHGFVLHCITPIPDMESSRIARQANLTALFGSTVIERLVLCGEPEAKHAILGEYAGSGCLWVEDVVQNAEYGLDHGLRSVIMDQPYNRGHGNSKILNVVNWKGVYDHAIGC